MSDYSRDIFRQLNELMERCDKFDSEMKDIKKSHKKEVKILNKKIDTLTKENTKLKEENKNLRADNARMKSILNNNSSNTSLPPSTDQKGKKKAANEYNGREKSNKNKGGQKGRKGTTLTKEDVIEKIESGEYKHEVIEIGEPSEKYVSKYVLDFVVTVKATEYRFYANESGVINIPAEFTSNVTYGPNVKAVAVDLNGEGMVSNKRITEFINTLTDGKLSVSEGAVYGFGKEFQKKSKELREQIANEVLNKEVVYTDATVVTVNGEQKHVRNQSADNVVYYSYTGSKTIESIRENSLLSKYNGILVHDNETALYHFGLDHAECNAHIKRYLRKNTEEIGHKWSEKLFEHLSGLNKRKKLLMSKEEFFTSREQKKAKKEYDTILEAGRKEYEKDKDNEEILSSYELSLLNRLGKYKNNHLLFIHNKNVDFTNNRSERDLRKFKNKQKMSGGFRNEEGCKLFCNIMTVIETFKYNKVKVLPALREIFKRNTPTLF